MTDAKAIKTEYKELKSAINKAPGELSTFKRLCDVFTPVAQVASFAGKITQIPAWVSGAGAAAGPYVPAVSAVLGVTSLVLKAPGLFKGFGKAKADETVRGYKTQFNRAARGYLAAQTVSTITMGLSALSYGIGEHFGVSAGNGLATVITGTVLGVVGMVSGIKAHANAAKLSVYGTAIKNAKNSPAAAEPSAPTVT